MRKRCQFFPNLNVTECDFSKCWKPSHELLPHWKRFTWTSQVLVALLPSLMLISGIRHSQWYSSCFSEESSFQVLLRTFTSPVVIFPDEVAEARSLPVVSECSLYHWVLHAAISVELGLTDQSCCCQNWAVCTYCIYEMMAVLTKQQCLAFWEKELAGFGRLTGQLYCKGFQVLDLLVNWKSL